jgi:guanine deaminase
MGHSIHLSPNEIARLKDLEAVAVHCPTSNMFLGSGFFPLNNLIKSGVKVGIASDVGGGTSYSMINNLDAAYKIQQFLKFSVQPMYSFYWATLGNARALGLEKEIGSFRKGNFADIVVLDTANDVCSEIRMKTCKSLTEELFVLQTLGGNHSIKAVYIAGKQLK